MSRRARIWLPAGVGALAAAVVVVVAIARLGAAPLLVNRAGMSQLVLARDGSLVRLGLSSDEHYRLWAPLDEIPAAMIEATLLQEDRFFFRHPGVNPAALLRAIDRTYVRGDRRVGASTITMQLARLRFDLDTRTWHGKLAQIVRAFWLELAFPKAALLEAYLNLAPYGANVEGVGAASWVWYGKPLRDLTPAEALSLAENAA